MNDTASRPLPLARILLILAALIALAAVGIAVWKGQTAAAPEAAAAAEPQPDVDTMISRLEARLRENPKDAEGWRMLGWAFFETGRFAESATAYRRAASLDPRNADYWSSLGEALVLAGSGDVPLDAAKAFDTAITLDPEDPRARYFLAVRKDIAGDDEGAIADWLALLADTPAGAPWEADLRRTIEQVAAREKIDVAARLAAIRPAAPARSTASAAIPGPTREQMSAASQLPPGQQEAMVRSMVDGLAAKLAANPRNPDGWIMLMRSRMTLGETRQATEDFRAAVAANPTARPELTAAAKELGVPGV